jgi:hypothetical protein
MHEHKTCHLSCTGGRLCARHALHDMTKPHYRKLIVFVARKLQQFLMITFCIQSIFGEEMAASIDSSTHPNSTSLRVYLSYPKGFDSS